MKRIPSYEDAPLQSDVESNTNDLPKTMFYYDTSSNGLNVVREQPNIN